MMEPFPERPKGMLLEDIREAVVGAPRVRDGAAYRPEGVAR
jgi:hypothetical protein